MTDFVSEPYINDDDITYLKVFVVSEPYMPYDRVLPRFSCQETIMKYIYNLKSEA